MKLKKQFADFYKEIKIDEKVEDLKEKREVLQGDIVLLISKPTSSSQGISQRIL